LKLLPDDIIRQVVGDGGVIENETQLLHALRGRLANSSLRVVRAGKETVVGGLKAPMRRVLEQRGVYASGVLFGPITIRDALEISAQGLMVHHVEPGSIGESQEIEKSDLLEAVDGVPVLEVDDLYGRLNDARAKRRRVTLTFKKLAGGDTLFSYTQRNLLVGELRIIGPQPAAP
jgi:S1-C subfamily serine protease